MYVDLGCMLGLCLSYASARATANWFARGDDRRRALRTRVVSHVGIQLGEHHLHDGSLALLPQEGHRDGAAGRWTVCISVFN